MAGGINLATKYSPVVDERWYLESQAIMALGNKYDFTGEKTVKVYSIPISVMKDYSRTGTSRYGSPDDLTRNVQTLTITKDRAFNFIIDKGDKIQSEMVSDAGQALARQLREVVVPEFDSYCFAKFAQAAKDAGGYASTAVTASNAYACFLAGMEYLGDHNVPEAGRVAFCTYKFANFMMQDPAFMKYSDKSQEMVIKGILGEVDGCKIVKVPSSRLPAGASFILAHAEAAVGPKQLEDYRIHDDPPGISGWLVEGRTIYDCFVLNEKRYALYYHGGQSVFKVLDAMSAATDTGKTTLIINAQKEASANKWYYMTATSAAGLTSITFGSAITTGNWTELTANATEITPTASHIVARIVEVDSADKPIAFADVPLNIG